MPALAPSLPTEIRFVVTVHPPMAVTHGFVAKICDVVPSKGIPDTRSDASETYATICAPEAFTTGEKLGPLAITPAGPTFTRISRGAQFTGFPRQVSRTKMLEVPLVSGLGTGGGITVVVSNRFVEEDVKVTYLPVASIEGPT